MNQTVAVRCAGALTALLFVLALLTRFFGFFSVSPNEGSYMASVVYTVVRFIFWGLISLFFFLAFRESKGSRFFLASIGVVVSYLIATFIWYLFDPQVVAFDNSPAIFTILLVALELAGCSRWLMVALGLKGSGFSKWVYGVGIAASLLLAPNLITVPLSHYMRSDFLLSLSISLNKVGSIALLCYLAVLVVSCFQFRATSLEAKADSLD